MTSTTENAYECLQTEGLADVDGSSSVELDVEDNSCVNILTAFEPFDEVMTWTGGTGLTTSTIHWTTVEQLGPTETYFGVVESGRYEFEGATRESLVTGTNGSNPLLCALGLGNVSQATGVSVLELGDFSDPTCR